MKINYEFTLNDCKIYAKEIFFIKRFFISFLKNNILRGLLASLLVAVPLPLLLGFSIKTVMIFFIEMLLCIYFLWGFMRYNSGKYIYKLLDGIDKNYELTIDNDILKRKSNTSESIFYWKYIKDIYNTKKNILIFISDKMAIVIPKRIFNTEKDIEDCWNYILSCFQTSRNM